jgi:hypothetical protein
VKETALKVDIQDNAQILGEMFNSPEELNRRGFKWYIFSVLAPHYSQ